MTSADFDNEVLKSINKKSAIEAMSGLYPHIPPAMIEQIYDFTSDPRYKDQSDLLYYETNYEALSAGELKKYYKLKNRYGSMLKNVPKHQAYTEGQIIEDAITVGERLSEEQVANLQAKGTFVPVAHEQRVHENDLGLNLSGRVM